MLLTIFYWIFCSKLCKDIPVSSCPLSCLEQFLPLISRYTSFTYPIDNGFKLPLDRMNFITVLNHCFHVSFDLIALTTDTVFVIQRVSFEAADSQAWLTSNNYRNDIRKNIFACLFSIHNTISLSRHEQVCLSGLPLRAT